MTSKSDSIGVTCTRLRYFADTFSQWNSCWKKLTLGTHDRKQMWLPDAHLCYFILSAARLCVAVLLHGAATSSAISPQMHQQNPADAPPESRGTIRIRRTPTESCLHLQRENCKVDSYLLAASKRIHTRAYTVLLILPAYILRADTRVYIYTRIRTPKSSSQLNFQGRRWYFIQSKAFTRVTLNQAI